MAKAKYVYIIIDKGIRYEDFRNLCRTVGIYSNHTFSGGVFKAWLYNDEKISKLTSILDILECSYDVAYSKEQEEPIWRWYCFKNIELGRVFTRLYIFSHKTLILL